jgi:RNA polymerase sigma-70 factor (ECF subfamily)
MSERADNTTTGKWNGAFHTTHWTEILDAQSEDEPRRRAALGQLLAAYWKPVYFYLRCKGYGREAAKDLTQGFFHEVFLGRGLVEQADRSRGRFRNFLLTALNRYATDLRRAQEAKQRLPEGGLVSMEEIDLLSIPEPVHYATPMAAFDYAWASALLDKVIGELAAECHGTGKAIHWELFQARVLLPIMENAESPSLEHLCERHAISEKARASHMILTVKRRFQVVLRRHVRQLVSSDDEVDEEIRHLMEIFSRS